MTTLDLLPYETAPGPQNMAADEVMLECATQGRALLRFYGWTTATVSLGYFQSHLIREHDPLLAPLPFVRRPTGGGTLVHHHELTYALALPAQSAGVWATAWLRRVHKMIAAALDAMEVHVRHAGPLPAPDHPRHSTPHASRPTPHALCFHQHAPVDLLIGQNKVLGSAQRKRRGAILQHGSVLLAQSPHTPTLPGIRELTGTAVGAQELAAAICDEWVRATKWPFERGEWTTELRTLIEEQCRNKYSQPTWNRKR